jgi:hypothetical protein
MVIKIDQLMMFQAKVAFCSEIRTKHLTQSEHHVEIFNVKPDLRKKKKLGFKRLMDTQMEFKEEIIEAEMYLECSSV